MDHVWTLVDPRADLIAYAAGCTFDRVLTDEALAEIKTRMNRMRGGKYPGMYLDLRELYAEVLRLRAFRQRVLDVIEAVNREPPEGEQ